MKGGGWRHGLERWFYWLKIWSGILRISRKQNDRVVFVMYECCRMASRRLVQTKICTIISSALKNGGCDGAWYYSARVFEDGRRGDGGGFGGALYCSGAGAGGGARDAGGIESIDGWV